MTELSYSDWADLLTWRFFRPDNAGRPIFLFADDTTIADIAQTNDAGTAVDSLVSAVKSRFGSEQRGDLLRSITSDGLDWFDRRATGAVPCLPLLATTVLAASRMAAEGEIAGHNYYKRLRGVLRLPGDGMPSDFGWSMEALWPRLSAWMDRTMAGSVGLSTIPRQPRLRYVGYPISQALWRSTDRQRFYEYLVDRKHRPGPVPDAEALSTAFAGWAAGQSGISPGARLLMGRSDLRELFVATVRSLAESWDGTAETRMRNATLRVTAKFPPLGRPEFGLAALLPIPPTEGFKDRSGDAFPMEWRRGWLLAGSDHVRAAMGVGLTVTADTVRARFDPKPIFPLIQQPELGRWISTSTVVSDAPMHILAHRSAAESLAAYLESAASAGWRRRPDDLLGGDWSLFSDVHLRAERARPTDPRLATLAILPSDIVEVSGGLREGRRYLAGAEPELRIRSGVMVGVVSIVRDGELFDELARDHPVRLAGRLGPGTHALVVGGATIDLDVVDRLPNGAIDRTLGVKLGELSMLGAALEPEDAAVPVVLARGMRHTLIGPRVGDIADVTSWTRPRLLHRLDVDVSRYEVWPPFPVAWVLSRARSRSYLRREMALDPDPGPFDASDASARRWAASVVDGVALATPSDRSAIEPYLDVAQGILR